MPSNNLMLSGNFFGMHLKKDILQISGGGIHYPRWREPRLDCFISKISIEWTK